MADNEKWKKKEPQLIWEWGTAYDFFISLLVLHRPDKFGLRGAWAKGVRTRLPAPEREVLEAAHGTFLVPLHWIYTLPKPKDSDAVLQMLERVPVGERLAALTFSPDVPAAIKEIFLNVGARGSWNTTDREALWKAAQAIDNYEPDSEHLTRELEWWAQKDAFGEGVLSALKAYQSVFFAEEEARIAPALQAAVARGCNLANKLPLSGLLEELSEGIRFEVAPEHEQLIMVPSFWVSPLIILRQMHDGAEMFVFGGRPEDASLVPGEMVPDALFRTLKALADPTRLRILYYLTEQPLSPSELSKRLRLRAPTVIHHLNTLRLAGLVFLSFERKGEKRYAARVNRVEEMYHQLQGFLRMSEGYQEDSNN